MSSNFCHLHLHSHFSLLDGANKLEDVVKKAAELKMPALALTDHGNLFGAVQFHDLAREYGVKPIIGCEVYVARNGRKSREGRSSQSNHLVLLARDEIGYHNLVRLVSTGYLEGFYYKPRIDKELLSQHAEGLVGLSACLQGSVASALTLEKYEEARQEAADLADMLGPGNFYLELQDHDIDEQRIVNEGVLRLAGDLDLPLVATNDCHYLDREDAYAHDVLLCIQTGKTIDDPNRLSYKTEEFFFKTAAEMEQRFGHVPEALNNTLAVAEMCNFEFGQTRNIFPDFDVPEGETVESYFEKTVREGFGERVDQLKALQKEDRLRHDFEDYEDRLKREIDIIKQMNFSAYFLIVWDFVRYAREASIPVGPGRGSAAGSLVSYALKITDVDPLQYDLLFERFLNPERVTPPDIDIDFCMLRRGEVIDYVTNQYGQESVSHIITFGTMAARGAVRDVGRGLNVPYSEVDKLAKLVPQTPDTNLKKAVEEVAELRNLTQDNAQYGELFNVARRLEGMVRHASTHAAGVVIAPQPLIELIPLYKSNKDEITTQYPMSDLERLGLLKMDFLGLTTLTIIEQALDQIREQRGEELDLADLPLDDGPTLQLFAAGRTNGIFQFESSGMRDILRRLLPSRIEDLIALNALYRPGPIQGGMIDDFIERRHQRVTVEYDLPELEEILKETYGVIVYQEQVMQIASVVGGFSLGEADLLRRAMGKKKKSVMEGQRKKFLQGAAERQFDAGKAQKIFELMEQFAGYGFNKSHSTAYALLAYQTGYLKTHYPVQFMAALLTNEMSNTDKMVYYLGECRDMGMQVDRPDINSGKVHFVGTGEKQIAFGLGAVKNVGEGAIEAVLEARENLGGEFSDFYEFCENVELRSVNKRVLEALVKAGTFDSLGYARKSLMESLERAHDHGAKTQRDKRHGQGGLFGELPDQQTISDLPDVGEWGDREKWAFEKEMLGFYLTGHPLEKYASELKSFSRHSTQDLKEENGGREVAVGGIISQVRRLQTRRGDTMAAFQLEDLHGSVEVLLWPNNFQKHQALLDSEIPVLVRGRCDVDDRGDVKLLANEMLSMETLWKDGVQRACIRIDAPRLKADRIEQFDSLLRRFPGPCPIEFEVFRPSDYRLRLIPTQEVSVDPVPDFVQQVEQIFGEKSCVLELSGS